MFKRYNKNGFLGYWYAFNNVMSGCDSVCEAVG